MNCPYCDFHFRMLAATGMIDKTSVAPVLCESCLEVSLLANGRLQKITEQQLGWLKESHAFKTVIGPLQKRLKKRKAAHNN